MAPTDVARERFAVQQLHAPRFTDASALVQWFGAVQAQDVPGGQWAIGQRLRDGTLAAVEDAIAARAIVRTWPMRGTLHYVAAPDVRWMLRLLAPRVIARTAPRYRQLGLDEAALRKARRIAEKALQDGRLLTRPEVYAAFERGGVATGDMRGLHILAYLAQVGLLCFGPRRGKQPTLALLEDWLPPVDDPPRDEALGRLAARYFTSHGPATQADFAWWSGLLLSDARRAIDVAGGALREEERDGMRSWRGAGPRLALPRTKVAALLPVWDELLVAYRDRTEAVADLRPADRARPMIMSSPLVAVDGRVRGSWRRTLDGAGVRVEVLLWAPLDARETKALAAAAARYGRFLGREATLRISSSGSRRSP